MGKLKILNILVLLVFITLMLACSSEEGADTPEYDNSDPTNVNIENTNNSDSSSSSPNNETNAGDEPIDSPQSGTCFDGIQNQNEEGIDCGGNCDVCNSDTICFDTCVYANDGECDHGSYCEDGTDCSDCSDGASPSETCVDDVQNQNEEGVDCGGVCSTSCSSEQGPLTNFQVYVDPCSTYIWFVFDANAEINVREIEMNVGGHIGTQTFFEPTYINPGIRQVFQRTGDGTHAEAGTFDIEIEYEDLTTNSLDEIDFTGELIIGYPNIVDNISIDSVGVSPSGHLEINLDETFAGRTKYIRQYSVINEDDCTSYRTQPFSSLRLDSQLEFDSWPSDASELRLLVLGDDDWKRFLFTETFENPNSSL